MKKLILLSTVVATAISSYGQGTVLFQNPGQPIVNSETGANVDRNSFKVSLYALPDSATAPTTADFNNALVFTASLAANGIFAIGPGVRIESVTPPGGFAWLQVRAWETAFGADYAAASTVIGALVGTSTPFRCDTGDPTTTPAGTPVGIVAGGFKSFQVFPVVPEPTAIGLGLLGLGSLLFLRRRK